MSPVFSIHPRTSTSITSHVTPSARGTRRFRLRVILSRPVSLAVTLICMYHTWTSFAWIDVVMHKVVDVIGMN